MNTINNKYKKSVGFKGELAVIDKLKTLGFCLYGKNIKYIDSEIDIVMYKYNKDKNTLDIRVVEVKTRNNYEFNLSSFDIPKKWRLAKKHLFDIKSSIDDSFGHLAYSKIHFDLAMVKYNKDQYIVYSYIKDVNLLI